MLPLEIDKRATRFIGVDVGEYRAIYEPDPAEAPALIRVLLVGKRHDDEVYRKLRRILGT